MPSLPQRAPGVSGRPIALWPWLLAKPHAADQGAQIAMQSRPAWPRGTLVLLSFRAYRPRVNGRHRMHPYITGQIYAVNGGLGM